MRRIEIGMGWKKVPADGQTCLCCDDKVYMGEPLGLVCVIDLTRVEAVGDVVLCPSCADISGILPNIE